MTAFYLPTDPFDPKSITDLIDSREIILVQNNEGVIGNILIGQAVAYLDGPDADIVPHVRIGDKPEKKGKKYYAIMEAVSFHKPIAEDGDDKYAAESRLFLVLASQIMRFAKTFNQCIKDGDIKVINPEHN